MMTTAISNEALLPKPLRHGRRAVWSGRIVSAVPILALVASGLMKLGHAPAIVEKWTTFFGFPESTLTGIGVLELLCVATYAIPRTSVLGAILISAYLGGAVSAHVRIGDSITVPVVLGILAWAGLWLRETRLRPLAPLRTPAP